LPDEVKALLRETLTGLMTPEEIEAAVNERQLVPKSHLLELPPEVQAIVDETLENLIDISHMPAPERRR
jgi:hypothetical protein